MKHYKDVQIFWWSEAIELMTTDYNKELVSQHSKKIDVQIITYSISLFMFLY